MSDGIHTPPGFDMDPYLMELNSGALEHSSKYRRAVTCTNPILWALTYLPHCLKSEETGSRISLSQFHIDMALGAKRWIRTDLRPGEVREAWIAPREAAKSTWLHKILPLWALAFQHQKFILSFSNAGKDAERQLGSVKREIETNELLRLDFPKLCEPRSTRGNRKTNDRADLYVASSGVAMAALGIEASSLGMKIGDQRPTMILLDDIEPDESGYDATTKKDRLAAISSKILPMAMSAVVQWAGTTTNYGSLVHDLVRAATGEDVEEWIGELGFTARYYPPFTVDDEGRERSWWPQRWSTADLQKLRAQSPRLFAMNYANHPVGSTDGMWKKAHFRYDADFPIADGVLSIDPAVTNGVKADFTAMSVVATNVTRQRVSVQSAEQARLSPAGMRERVVRHLELNDWISEVILESNQGGDIWMNVLDRLPRGVKLTLYRSTVKKASRYDEALYWFERDLVSLRAPLPAFENQALAYPGVVNDDVLDAVTAGVAHYLRGAR